MPFDPHATFEANPSSNIGNFVASQISDAFRRQREERQQGANADMLVHGARALGHVSDNDYASYFAAPAGSPERLGMSNAITANSMATMMKAKNDAQLQDAAREGQPQPMRLGDGSAIPNRYYVPGAHTVIDTSPASAPGAPPSGLTIPPGWVWNGKQLVQQHDSSGNNDDVAQLQNLARTSKLQNIDQQIGAAQGEIAAGNKRPGPDWLPFTTPYSDQVKQLQAQRDAIANGVSAGASSPAMTVGRAPIISSPAAAAQPQGVGGYVPGRSYSGKTYAGGDPNDPNNWQ
ncbi:MAG: hypothetical protein ACR2HH_15860 [Chthoniobacterales bacterium]